MVNFCAIVGCGNRGNRDSVSFFRLPAVIRNQGDQTERLSTERRQVWLSRIARADIKECNLSYIRVCSDHFVSGKTAALYDQTNPDWAPTLKLGHDKDIDSQASCSRYERKVKRQKNRSDLEAASVLLDLAGGTKTDRSTELNQCTSFVNAVSTQTDLTMDMISILESEVTQLQEEKHTLKANVDQLTLNEDFFQNDDRVKFYTGLPNFLVLLQVLNFVGPYINVGHRSLLSRFQQLVLTLMRCRLNLSVQDLGYRFCVSSSTASRVFKTVIDVLCLKMGFLVKWPSREELMKTMPMSFRVNFGTKVAVIIDCFEVFMDRPSNLMARAQTWSIYKHHNTAKFLIGITPQGVVSYISRSWGGRVSDKYLTENCGFLDNILPGDLVLADRGFDLSDSVGLRCAEIQIPSFLRGKKQLSMAEVISTRKIANVRIHVERVIGSVRQKYTILNGPVPMDFLLYKDQDGVPLLDKLAVVCCALTNLSPSVVQFE